MMLINGLVHGYDLLALDLRRIRQISQC